MKTKRIINILLTLTIIFTILSTNVDFNTKASYAENINDQISTNTSNTENTENGENLDSKNNNKENLHIYSDSVLLMENKTGRILYEKNSEQKMYPASTTKILTALIAIEKGNLDDKVTVSQTALAQMKAGYSSAYLIAGEVMSVQNLLEVLLVHSANDASNVLAEYISGSIDGFVNLMNQKLAEMGCTHSHFVTTNGLHDDNHYTTAKDMATIARYCMQNPTFRKIVSMKKCTIPATNKSPKRIYKNTNDLLIPTSGYYYPNCIGIKTGYTSEAKNCLVSACNKDGLQLIAIVFGASLTENNKSARYVDSETLYNYGYENFSYKTIAKEKSVVDKIEVKNATDDSKMLDLTLEKNITALVHNKDIENIKHEITLNDKISAPISANTVLGTVTYTIGSDSYTANLLASHDVVLKKGNIILGIFKIIILLIIFMVILILILILIKKHNRKNAKHY